MPEHVIDYARLKEGQRWMWGLGDYVAVAEHLAPQAELLAEAAGVKPGMSVLDVAAGNGNFAIAAARHRASVVATDLTPKMIELGKARTGKIGLDVAWQQADAEELPFDDGRFDLVGSVFGAMFAPRPDRVAAELFRVVKPGGTVAMANYSHAGFLGAMGDLMARYSFAPPGGAELPSPFSWGDEAEVRLRFAGRAASIRLETRTVSFVLPSVSSAVDFWERTNAPLQALKAMLPAGRYGDARAAIVDLMGRMARETADGIALDSSYLQVLAVKPAR